LKKPSIPAIVRPTKDEDMKLLALLENVQREDLSMMEKVRAVGELKERLGNVDAVAAKLGWSRRTGFIYSRIGESDSFYQEIIQKQGLDLRKAEALLSAVDRLKKSGDKNALESFNNELKAGSNSVFDSIERFSPSTQANSTGKKKVGGKGNRKRVIKNKR
jgi:ParB-like chromosome segregation protein Spo0J